jgi:hypothetical protein
MQAVHTLGLVEQAEQGRLHDLAQVRFEVKDHPDAHIEHPRLVHCIQNLEQGIHKFG